MDNIEDVCATSSKKGDFVTKSSLKFEIHAQYVEIIWCPNKLVVCNQPHSRQLNSGLR